MKSNQSKKQRKRLNYLTSESINILAEIDFSTFEILRRSNPTAAFNLMIENLTVAVQNDGKMNKAFKKLKRNFKGIVLNEKDAYRLKYLEERKDSRSGIKVDSLSNLMAVGIAYLQEATIETLRSSDKEINPKIKDPKLLHALNNSMDKILPLIGSSGVTAFELSINDKDFRDRIAKRAKEIREVYLDDWHGPCEHCEFQRKDEDGTIIGSECGTEEQCEGILIIILIILAVLVLKKIWDWIW